MSVSPFAGTRFSEYRGIKTTQYTYVKTPDEAIMLFDHIADPYQLNNLVGKTEYQKLQNKMEKVLVKKLEDIGDADFKHRQYYLDKWGYEVGEGRSIPYNTTPGKEVRVQSPNSY